MQIIYYILGADYYATPVREEFGEPVEIEDLPISDALKNELASWSEDYQRIIMLDMQDRYSESKKIDSLDNRGVLLSRQLARELGNNTKVKYYSEGKLCYL